MQLQVCEVGAVLVSLHVSKLAKADKPATKPEPFKHLPAEPHDQAVRRSEERLPRPP